MMDINNMTAQELMDQISYSLWSEKEWIKLYKIYDAWWANASEEDKEFLINQGCIETLYQTLYSFGYDPDEGLPEIDE